MPRSEADRTRWARALTSAGWAALVAYVALLAVAINRARLTDEAPFNDGVWGQRLEVLSFAAFPQQVIVLVPAVAAALGAALLGRDALVAIEPWHARLVRGAAGAAFVAIGLAVADIAWIVVQNDESVGDFAGVVQRAGGIAIAWAVVRISVEIERDPG